MAAEKATQFSIERIVEKPTWKVILLELIATKRIDPWNIDIIEISDGFLKRINDMEKFDLTIPANIILAASILLRYKSDYLNMIETNEMIDSIVDSGIGSGGLEDLPQLQLSDRVAPKRQITLDELITEMEGIIKYENTDRIIKKRGGIDTIINLQIDEVDIEKKMSEVLVKIKNNVDKEGWTMFSRIMDRGNTLELIHSLLSVLHLTQKELIIMRQDEFFGDIFIKYIGTENGKEKIVAN